MVLGFGGAVAGVGLGGAATRAIVSFAPQELPRLDEVHVSGPVLWFALAITLATSVLFGIGPALLAAGADINATIKRANNPQRSWHRGGIGQAVIVAEVALAVVLVGAAGLLVKSFAHLGAVDAGFNPGQVLTMTPVIRANSGDVLRRYRQMTETVRSVPGVVSAAMVSNVPLSHAEPAKFTIEGRPLASDAEAPDADIFWVSPDYFRVLEIPLKAGRFLTVRDGVEEPPAALVSASFADKQFGGVEAIGRRLTIGARPAMTIVGIVGDVRHEGLDRDANQAIYEPQALNPFHYSRLVVRTAGNPWDFERPIRRALRELDPTIAIFHVQPMEAYVASSLAARTFSLTVLGLFGSLALVLAAIGVCGVYAHSVAQRTMEIGIRAALGATPMSLMRSVLGACAALLTVGIVVGEVMSLWANGLLASQLYGVGPRDPSTMIATAVCTRRGRPFRGLASRAAGRARGSDSRAQGGVEVIDEIAALEEAIDTNDLARVKSLMTRDPALHHAPLGYGKNGPLTWVAECRVPWEPPSPARLAIAEWMLENGSDVHQGGDGPLMRAALKGNRIPMMELLVSRGADVNAEWNGDFPIIFAPCESLDPDALEWLLDRGANPNCGNARRGTALDYVIGTYARSPEQLAACIDMLLAAGGTTKYNAPGVLEVLRGLSDQLGEQLDADSTLIHRRFPELDCGSTGGRRLLLQGATLLHVAAEFGSLEAATLLLDRGADVNARATVNDAGVGGHTAIFHAVTQFGDRGLATTQLLVERGADLGVRATLPGHYERLDVVVDCTPLVYALQFRDESHSEGRTIAFLLERGAIA